MITVWLMTAFAGAPDGELAVPKVEMSLDVNSERSTIEQALECPEKTEKDISDESVVCRSRAPRGAIPPKNGPGVWFHENGTVKRYGMYRDNKAQGVWVKLYPSGDRKEVVELADGERHGVSVSWWENGQPMSEMRYRDGLKQGWSRTWDEEGALLVSKRWEKDVAVEVVPGPQLLR